LETQDDARYVAQVVSQRAGISQQEAEKRVNDTYAKLKDAETKAKEAGRTRRARPPRRRRSSSSYRC